MTLRSFSALALVAAFALMVASRAASADTPGWYAGGGGGWSGLETLKSGGNNIGFNNGFGTIGFGGYNFGMVRAEGEVGYRQYDAHSLPGAAGPGSPSGNANALSFMANGLYNIPVSGSLTPYIGAGLGVVRLGLGNVAAGGVTFVNDTDTRLAYQGIAGVSYAVSHSISLGLDYRYLAALDPTFKLASGASYQPDFHTHSIFLNVTYHFGAPAPPAASPAVAPAVAPAIASPVTPAIMPAAPRTFLVFFDFDKTTLTSAGTRVLEEAANTFRNSGSARLDLAGYTDLSGSAKYNLELSRRRAETVRDYLVKLTVPASAITETARGKENPRVPTLDGVREPQNRRVEIVLP